MPTPGLNLTRHQLDTVHIHPDSISRTLTKAALPAKMRIAGILRGAKPGDLPVQFPPKYEMAVNLKTAKALGLTVPETLLATADEVIQ